jgi:subtilase family serine protease
MRSLRRPIVLASAVLPIVALAAGALTGQAGAAEPRTALTTAAAPGMAGTSRLGAVDSSQRVAVAVTLRLRHTDQLKAFLARVSDPSSAEYGHYLTPARFTAEYGPTRADVAAVSAHLRAAGLTVTSVSGNRQVIDATGPAKAVGAAFGTSLGRYHDARQGRNFYANDRAPTLPASLAKLVTGVNGLNNHYQRQHYSTPTATAAPHSNASPDGGYTPTDLRTAYDLTTLGGDGSGVTVGMWEFDGYKASNLSKYSSQYKLSTGTVTTRSVDGANYDSSPGDGQIEVELDIEMGHAVAPKANQVVYEAPNTDAGEVDMANAVAADNRVSVLSISWGACEPDRTLSEEQSVDQAFQQMAAEGISVFSASGDDGSRDCSRSTSGSGVVAVDFPAADPYVSGTGGTTLHVNSNSTWSSETAWSGSGGGVSTVWAAPSYQNGGSNGKRTVPDISSVADPNTGVSVYSAECLFAGFCFNTWLTVGGTSDAAPQWAGFAALYNQKAAAAGKARLGFANPRLYQVGASSSYGSSFHDIASGSNTDFSAATGYDKVTGWGTLRANGLATALLAQ